VSSHLHVCRSSRLEIFTFSHLHVCRSSRLEIFASSHLHVRRSSGQQIFTSSDFQVLTSLRLQIFTSSDLQVFTSSVLQIFKSSDLLFLALSLKSSDLLFTSSYLTSTSKIHFLTSSLLTWSWYWSFNINPFRSRANRRVCFCPAGFASCASRLNSQVQQWTLPSCSTVPANESWDAYAVAWHILALWFVRAHANNDGLLSLNPS